MFKLNLPTGAILEVTLPEGGTTMLVHRGGGEFISTHAIRALAGASAIAIPDGASNEVTGEPLHWETDAGQHLTNPIVYLFDVAGAYAEAKAAALKGDAVATGMLMGAVRGASA